MKAQNTHHEMPLFHRILAMNTTHHQLTNKSAEVGTFSGRAVSNLVAGTYAGCQDRFSRPFRLTTKCGIGKAGKKTMQIKTYKPRLAVPTAGEFDSTIKGLFETTVEGRTVQGVKRQSKSKLGLIFNVSLPDGKSAEVLKHYDPTLKKSSELRQHLRSIRGRDVNPEELVSFDANTIVGLKARVLVKRFREGKNWCFKLVSVLEQPSLNHTNVAELVATKVAETSTANQNQAVA